MTLGFSGLIMIAMTIAVYFSWRSDIKPLLHKLDHYTSTVHPEWEKKIKQASIVWFRGDANATTYPERQLVMKLHDAMNDCVSAVNDMMLPGLRDTKQATEVAKTWYGSIAVLNLLGAGYIAFSNSGQGVIIILFTIINMIGAVIRSRVIEMDRITTSMKQDCEYVFDTLEGATKVVNKTFPLP